MKSPANAAIREKPGGEPATPGRNGFAYRPQFAVIVVCKDEADHREVYERLKAEGLACRPVSV